MRDKGDAWNELTVSKDPETGREIRRLTDQGLLNEKPAYHTNTAFTADGEYVVFARAEGGRSAVMKCHVPTGELTQLIDPVDGVASSWAPHKMGRSEVIDGRGISGVLLCVAPTKKIAAYTAGRSVRTVHLETLEENTLIEDIGIDWVDGVMSINPSETHLLIPLMPAHPEVRDGKEPTRGYMECFAEGGMVTRLLEVPLEGGESRVVFEDPGMGCAHCPHSPTDDDLILIDRDRAPKFWGGGDDCKSPRCWTLRLSTGDLTELDPRNAQKFHVHAAWTWDGESVLYHSWRNEGGYYIGITNKSGEVVREYDFPDGGAYGHVSAADPGRPAIILDGNVTTDKLVWLYYDQEEPRLETIATHGTEWGSVPAQYSHPHPQSDPTGKWIVYNVARDGRTDIWVARIT